MRSRDEGAIPESPDGCSRHGERVRHRRHRAYLCTHLRIQYWLDSRLFRHWIRRGIQYREWAKLNREWVKPNQSDVKLNPPIPPGRSNRKARAFSAEIARLSQEGYGCKAIHQALASAGMTVSKSTVQREVARLAKPASPAEQPMVTPVLRQGVEPPSIMAMAPNGQGAFQEQRTSKDVAEAFLKGRITKPLFRKRI